MPPLTRIKLGRHQAAAIRAEITEVNTLQQLAQNLANVNKRHTDAIVADAGHDPVSFHSYALVEDGGETYMELVHAPTPLSIPSAPSTPISKVGT